LCTFCFVSLILSFYIYSYRREEGQQTASGQAQVGLQGKAGRVGKFGAGGVETGHVKRG